MKSDTAYSDILQQRAQDVLGGSSADVEWGLEAQIICKLFPGTSNNVIVMSQAC